MSAVQGLLGVLSPHPSGDEASCKRITGARRVEVRREIDCFRRGDYSICAQSHGRTWTVLHDREKGSLDAVRAVGEQQLCLLRIAEHDVGLDLAGTTRTGRAAMWRLALASLLFFLCFSSKESGVGWAGFAPLVVLGLAVKQSAATRWLTQLRGQALPWLGAVGIPLVIFLWLRHRMLVEHVDPFGAYAVSYDHNPLFYMSAWERLPSGVMLLVEIFEALAGDVGVDLRR